MRLLADTQWGGGAGTLSKGTASAPATAHVDGGRVLAYVPQVSIIKSQDDSTKLLEAPAADQASTAGGGLC